MTGALVVGKFYPPHRGHIRLVREALRVREHVVVVCLGSTGDTLHPSDRLAALLEDAASTGIDTTRIHGESGFDETPFDLNSAAAWASHVEIFRCHMRRGPGVDVLVSSETYGPTLAAQLGLEHHTCDLERMEVPVSATDVRREPLRQWSSLGPGTRALLTTRVIVLGAESTGTTTVARMLAERLSARGGPWVDTQWVGEYGRELTQRKQREAATSTGVLPLSVPWSADNFADVVRMQQQLEDTAARCTGPVLVCDTDAFATTVWERRYLGLPGAHLDPALLGRGHVYLLTDHVGVPFEQDGTRDGKHVRTRMTADFQDGLVAHRRPWAMLSGSLAERVDLAERITDQVVRRRLTFADPI